MVKKEKSKKLARKFKDGQWVYDPYTGKKLRYNHNRDFLAAYRFKEVKK